MSLNIRHLTNGTKDIFTVVNSGVTPTTFDVFDKVEDIDMSIRHYASKEAMLVDADSARMFGVLDILYPNWPKCIDATYKDGICIAPECNYFKSGECICNLTDGQLRHSQCIAELSHAMVLKAEKLGTL